MNQKKFEVYCNFCEECGRYYGRLKKHGYKKCIFCTETNHNLRNHYPETEIDEYLSTTKDKFIVGEDNKIFKVKEINIDDKGSEK